MESKTSEKLLNFEACSNILSKLSFEICGFRLYFSMSHFTPDKSHYSWFWWNTDFVPSLNPSNPLSGIVLCEHFHLRCGMLNYKTLNVTQNSVKSGQCPVYNQEEAEPFMRSTHIFHHSGFRNPLSQCGHRNYHQTWNSFFYKSDFNSHFLRTKSLLAYISVNFSHDCICF